MSRALPSWAVWHGGTPARPYTVGIEEEVMLLDPDGWQLAHAIDDVLGTLSPELAAHASAETHASAIELTSGVHETVGGAAAELLALREALEREVAPLGLRVASAGTHPTAEWQDTVVSSGARQQLVQGSMRELARREPTFSLHVHVGVAEPDCAVALANRLRGHLPLLLALSANSPFWQGRDSGLASARTPVFGAFPRVGIPRAFRDYADYAEAVDLMIRSRAIPEPTFLWWDVRLQPRLGTVEVRIMDAQATAAETAALGALVHAAARLELVEGWISPRLVERPEVLDENRFLAARDGVAARLIDPDREARVPVREQAAALLDACRPHAAELGCAGEFAGLSALLEQGGGAARQRALAAACGDDLDALVERLADGFCTPLAAPPAREPASS